MTQATFQPGDLVKKKSGSSWRGRIVGEYSATFTKEGYDVESMMEPGNVQVYPVAALEPWDGRTEWDDRIDALKARIAELEEIMKGERNG